MTPLLLYGANGYTGKLIAHEAVRQGLKPVLAGRNRAALDALAQELGLTRRVFGLERADEIARNLEGMALVLNCAGPFSATVGPMLDACLTAHVHYLDITGEIAVFEHCHRAHARARHEGVVVIPGTGFDVVPTDCLAALLKQRLPDADRLVLAFDAGGGPSPGTAKTSVEGLARGGRARIDGELREVPLGWKSREFVREDGTHRSAMTIPWGDVYTAFVSTGIANIETYMTVPPRTIARMRWLRHLRPLLGLAPVQRYLKGKVEAGTPGPSAQRRAETGCYVWGEVGNARGDAARLALTTPNGYDLTATASVGIVQHLLRGGTAGGYYTPSQLMGADYILRLPGTRLVESAPAP
ncbi:MAG: saccharopine dehydrogenase NADP-binding domain-containing protein [Lysobacterales bacterium]